MLRRGGGGGGGEGGGGGGWGGGGGGGGVLLRRLRGPGQGKEVHGSWGGGYMQPGESVAQAVGIRRGRENACQALTFTHCHLLIIFDYY